MWNLVYTLRVLAKAVRRWSIQHRFWTNLVSGFSLECGSYRDAEVCIRTQVSLFSSILDTSIIDNASPEFETASESVSARTIRVSCNTADQPQPIQNHYEDVTTQMCHKNDECRLFRIPLFLSIVCAFSVAVIGCKRVKQSINDRLLEPDIEACDAYMAQPGLSEMTAACNAEPPCQNALRCLRSSKGADSKRLCLDRISDSSITVDLATHLDCDLKDAEVEPTGNSSDEHRTAECDACLRTIHTRACGVKGIVCKGYEYCNDICIEDFDRCVSRDTSFFDCSEQVLKCSLACGRLLPIGQAKYEEFHLAKLSECSICPARDPQDRLAEMRDAEKKHPRAESPSQPADTDKQERNGAPPSVTIGAPMVNGHLEPRDVESTIMRETPRFRACYEAGLRNNPSLQGRVSTRFIVGSDGYVSHVANAASDLPDADVINCVNRVYYGIAFPKPKNGIVTVIFSLLFSPK